MLEASKISSASNSCHMLLVLKQQPASLFVLHLISLKKDKHACEHANAQKHSHMDTPTHAYTHLLIFIFSMWACKGRINLHVVAHMAL